MDKYIRYVAGLIFAAGLVSFYWVAAFQENAFEKIFEWVLLLAASCILLLIIGVVAASLIQLWFLIKASSDVLQSDASRENWQFGILWKYVEMASKSMRHFKRAGWIAIFIIVYIGSIYMTNTIFTPDPGDPNQTAMIETE